MKHRNPAVRTATALGCAALLLLLGACAMDPGEETGAPAEGTVRLTGMLSGLVGSASRSARADARTTVRALGSAVVNVAALPVVAGELRVDAADTAATTEVSEDGGFEVDVPQETETEHVLLVNAPETGVGVEQGLGFIELLVGDETSRRRFSTRI